MPGHGPAAGRPELRCHGPGLGACFWPLLSGMTRIAGLPFFSQLAVWQFNFSEVILVVAVLPFYPLLFKTESFLTAVV